MHAEHVETRPYLGRTQFKIHRVNGESAWQDAVDARQTVQRLPEEWSYKPFCAAEQKAALKDMAFNPEHVAA